MGHTHFFSGKITLLNDIDLTEAKRVYTLLMKRVKTIQKTDMFIPTDFDSRFRIQKRPILVNITVLGAILPSWFEPNETIAFGIWRFENNEIITDPVSYGLGPSEDCLSALIEFLSFFGAKDYSGKIKYKSESGESAIITVKDGKTVVEYR